MHNQAIDFTLFVKSILGDYFMNKRVLDVGSGDLNGNNRFLFENCDYTGNDVAEAPNVTIVSKTKDLLFGPESFDTIISTECFEHDPEYKESILKIVSMLKPNGLFCFTCASTGRNEHGTRRANPEDSYGTKANIADMYDYYKNLVISDINEVVNLSETFSSWNSYYSSENYDLYFVGIKRGSDTTAKLHQYLKTNVTNTSSQI